MSIWILCLSLTTTVCFSFAQRHTSSLCPKGQALILHSAGRWHPWHYRDPSKLLRKEDREGVRLEDRASRVQETCVHLSGLRHSEVAMFKPTEIFHPLACPSPLGSTSRHGINICHSSVMKGSQVQVQMKTPRAE